MLRRLALEIESQTEECDCCGDSFGLRTVTLTLPGQFLCPRCESIYEQTPRPHHLRLPPTDPEPDDGSGPVRTAGLPVLWVVDIKGKAIGRPRRKL